MQICKNHYGGAVKFKDSKIKTLIIILFHYIKAWALLEVLIGLYEAIAIQVGTEVTVT